MRNDRFRKMGKLLTCTKCEGVIKDRLKDINLHLRVCEARRNVSRKTYHCKICKDQKFITKVIAKKHLMDKHFDELFKMVYTMGDEK